VTHVPELQAYFGGTQCSLDSSAGLHDPAVQVHPGQQGVVAHPGFQAFVQEDYIAEANANDKINRKMQKQIIIFILSFALASAI
jgi:hypothetical protein